MVKGTCLVALKRKDRNPCIHSLEIPIYSLLKVFIYLILEIFVREHRNEFPNAQTYNHTNTTTIRIEIAYRERDCDSENFGTRMT
jgi:hypothetical protein